MLVSGGQMFNCFIDFHIFTQIASTLFANTSFNPVRFWERERWWFLINVSGTVLSRNVKLPLKNNPLHQILALYEQNEKLPSFIKNPAV